MIETGVLKLEDGAGCRVRVGGLEDCFQCRCGKSWDGFADSDCTVEVVEIYGVKPHLLYKESLNDVIKDY